MITPYGLLVNLLSKPERTVITDPSPRFSWIVPGTSQSAFRILVASKSRWLAEGRADLWDSGRVESVHSLHIPHGGSPLRCGQTVWWTVRTWDVEGIASDYAAPQCFHIGRTDHSGDRWPGESQWVRIADADGSTAWTLEDRHPISYHPHPPVRTVIRPDGVTFLDFGRAAFSSLRLTLTWNPPVDASQTSQIEIAVGEKADSDHIDSLPGGGVIFRRYPLELRAGTHTYDVSFPRFVPKYPHSQAMPDHMPEVVPFRYGEAIPGKLSVDVAGAEQRALWYEFNEEAASFRSSSPDLDAVYELCRYSLKANTFNGDYASSERERMMYEADTFIQQMGHYAVDREFAIARYSIENMLYHGSWPTEWIPHCLLMAWADYMHTGDTTLLTRHYETLKPKTLAALAGEDGLISTRTGLQTPEFLASIHAPPLRDIVDWPTHMADDFDFRNFNTVVNAFHYQSLVLMARIAGVLGRDDDRSSYANRATMVRHSFQAAFFDPEASLYRDGTGSTHHSFHANLFALAFDLAQPDHKPALLAWLKSRGMACGVYPAHYVLETFYDNDAEEHALDLLTSTSDRVWLNMLRMGSTVTTEAWDMKYKHNISWSHAWSSSPAHIIPRKLMGIEPAEPGFGRVTIRPRLGSLEDASVKLPTIRGDILLSVVNRPSEPYALDLTLPGNVMASVILPAFTTRDDIVSVNGQSVQAARDANNLILSEIGPGCHRIERKRF